MRRQRDIDYYKVLGVSENATQEQILSAYRDRLKLLHPDKFKSVLVGEEDAALDRELNRKAADVNEAYEVLKDPDGRRQHDWFLKQRRNEARASTGSPSSGGDSKTTSRPSSANEGGTPRSENGRSSSGPSPGSDHSSGSSSGKSSQGPQAEKQTPSSDQGQRTKTTKTASRSFAPALWAIAALVAIVFVAHYFWAAYQNRKEAELEAVNQKVQQEKIEQEQAEANKRNAVQAQKSQQDHKNRIRQLAMLFPDFVNSNEAIAGWWQAEEGWTLIRITGTNVMFYDWRLDVDKKVEYLSLRFAGGIASFDGGVFTVDWSQVDSNGLEREGKTRQWIEDGITYNVTEPNSGVMGLSAAKMRQRLEISRNKQGNRMWVQKREGQGPDMGDTGFIYHRVRMPSIAWERRGPTKFSDDEARTDRPQQRVPQAFLTWQQGNQNSPVVPFPSYMKFSAAEPGLVWQPAVAWRGFQGG